MTAPNFNIGEYSSLPYLNIDATAETTIKLSELFEYQKLTIPAAAATTAAAPTPGAATAAATAPTAVSAATTTSGSPDLDYHILNIKKQFICVKFGTGVDEKSRIYVKKPVIDKSLKENLPLISIDDKTIQGKIVFDGLKEPTAANSGDEKDVTGLDIFTKVYQKITADKQPYFADGTNAFLGGRKGGGSRKKQGGSRSR